MIAQFHNLAVSAGRRARSAVWPTLAKRYRKDPSKASSLMLKVLGIADISYRPNFAALANAVDNVPDPEGNVIECGVFRGSTLLGMAHRLALRGMRRARLFGCDSFEGFPAPSQEDALSNGSFHEHARKGVYADTDFDRLRWQIASLGFNPTIQLMRGYFEDTLPQLAGLRFSIAHLDCDLYQSYVTCLDFVYPRLVQGGYMVFDEYAAAAPVYPGAQKAIDRFFADKPEKLQSYGEGPHARHFIVKI